MNGTTRRTMRELFVWIAAAAAPVSGGLAARQVTDCAIDGVRTAVKCGRVRVPEDHDGVGGRTIDLNVVVLPAMDPRPDPDPLFIVTGGPGQAATDLVVPTAQGRSGAFASRDLVFVDQRGTGASNPLTCPTPTSIRDYFGEVLPSDDLLEACAHDLAGRADVRLYTTTQSVRDLEAVRRALGYGRIDLSGASYGTRLVLEYVRHYPEHVRAAVLVGVVPPDFQAPLMYAPYARQALKRLWDDCAADPKCAQAYPDVRTEWASLLDRLRRTPAQLVVTGPDGVAEDVAFTANDLAYTVRSMLYGPDALSVPGRVHASAVTGDVGAFAQAYADRAQRVWTSISAGLHLSVFCSEDVPFIDDSEAAQASAGTPLGTYLVDEYRRACRHWPKGRVPDDFRDPVVSAVPVLIRSGARDPSTAPATGEAVLAYLTRGVHIVHPFGGHVFAGTSDVGCERGIIDAFLESGTTDGLDTDCVARERPLPFRIEGAAGAGPDPAPLEGSSTRPRPTRGGTIPSRR